MNKLRTRTPIRQSALQEDWERRHMTMANFSLKDDDLIVGLKVFSTVAAGLFTGTLHLFIKSSFNQEVHSFFSVL